MNYYDNPEFLEAVAQYQKEYGKEMQGYVKFPKFLFDKKYIKLSLGAKILYACMLEREKISKENNWLDKTKRLFIYFTTKEISQTFNVSMPTAINMMNELRDANLIEKRYQGLGRPTVIYVNKPNNYTESYVN